MNGKLLAPVSQRLAAVKQRIRMAETLYGRPVGSVQLLAVSKTKSANEIRDAFSAGQGAFGESYLQEAVDKIRQLEAMPIVWHYIGRIQGNKTRQIAENFSWVHSVSQIKHAHRLSDQRPPELPPLKICLQINLSGETSKGGLEPAALGAMIEICTQLPNLELRGLMTLPAPEPDFMRQRLVFRQLRELRDSLATPAYPLATLSMGMSQDLEAAVAEGASIVRIGTAIFGPRPQLTELK